MKRFVITVPEDMPLDKLAILELIEPGASRHALMTQCIGTTQQIHHSRLNVTILEIHGVTR